MYNSKKKRKNRAQTNQRYKNLLKAFLLLFNWKNLFAEKFSGFFLLHFVLFAVVYGKNVKKLLNTNKQVKQRKKRTEKKVFIH